MGNRIFCYGETTSYNYCSFYLYAITRSVIPSGIVQITISLLIVSY